MPVKIKFVLTYAKVYHRCFRLLLRIVRISVYYGSSDRFSFHNNFEFKRRKYDSFLVADYRVGRKCCGTVGYGFYIYKVLLYNS